MLSTVRYHASMGHVPLTFVALLAWPCAPQVVRDASVFTTSVLGSFMFTDAAQVQRIAEYWSLPERALRAGDMVAHWLPLLLLAWRRDAVKPSFVHAMAVYAVALAYSFHLPLRVIYQHTSPLNLRAVASVLFWAWIVSAAL